MDERNEWWNGNEDGVFFRTERSVVVDHNIGTSRWTGIAEKGRRARSKENYGAGPTGLGLAICYVIVNDHGGQLDLVSPEGAGAVFRVSLPVGLPS